MKAKNKIHQAKKAKWLTLIKEQSESSLTIKQWCDLNGYTIHTFYYWKRLLKEEALQNISVPEIVPLVQPPSPVLQGESLPLNLCNSHKLHELETPSQNITVSFGDIRIEIGKNAPDDIIANIIKAVRHA